MKILNRECLLRFKKGVSEANTKNFFITPGDCPLVKRVTVQLIAAQTGDVVIPSFDYKGGHPIKLSKQVKQKILETAAESNLRAVLGGFEKSYINVDDPGVLMDVDTPADYQRAIDYFYRV